MKPVSTKHTIQAIWNTRAISKASGTPSFVASECRPCARSKVSSCAPYTASKAPIQSPTATQSMIMGAPIEACTATQPAAGAIAIAMPSTPWQQNVTRFMNG